MTPQTVVVHGEFGYEAATEGSGTAGPVEYSGSAGIKIGGTFDADADAGWDGRNVDASANIRAPGWRGRHRRRSQRRRPGRARRGPRELLGRRAGERAGLGRARRHQGQRETRASARRHRRTPAPASTRWWAARSASAEASAGAQASADASGEIGQDGVGASAGWGASDGTKAGYEYGGQVGGGAAHGGGHGEVETGFDVSADGEFHIGWDDVSWGADLGLSLGLGLGGGLHLGFSPSKIVGGALDIVTDPIGAAGKVVDFATHSAGDVIQGTQDFVSDPLGTVGHVFQPVHPPAAPPPAQPAPLAASAGLGGPQTGPTGDVGVFATGTPLPSCTARSGSCKTALRAIPICTEDEDVSMDFTYPSAEFPPPPSMRVTAPDGWQPLKVADAVIALADGASRPSSSSTCS